MPLQLPTWSQTKTTSKQGFDKVYNLVDKLGAPINRLSNKVGSEAFWPTTLDKESDKAARILRSFCKDGFYVEEPEEKAPAEGVPKGKVRVIKKIPTEVIRKAKGLAIFTTMRTGLWVSGAGGSGILVARKPDGEWSPPSGIMLHTAGLGFLVGVDIYDCVVVINSEKALEAFSKIRCTLGGEVSAVAGPAGIGGVLESEVHKRQAPVWTYLKSRGFYAGVQVDGTIIIERTDENERFYGERIKVADILAGKARHPPPEIKTLIATIKAAQGDNDVDESALPAAEPTPGDMELEKPEQPLGFGIPAEDDPDPFGVRALEAQGLEIKEAGSGTRPSLEVFEYRPSPSSPIFSSFRRHSTDSVSKGHVKRDSIRSISSTDRGTQTETNTPNLNGSPRGSWNHSPLEKTTESPVEDTESHGLGIVAAPEPEQQPLEQSAPQPILSRARLVTIPKRIPPALPPRSPYRSQPPPTSTTTDPSPLHSSTVADQGTNPRSPSPQAPSQYTSISLEEASPLSPHPNTLDLEQNLHKINLSPNPDQHSPRNDGFDAASMSGSDYSRETQTPAQTPGHEPTGTPLRMVDGGDDNEETSAIPATSTQLATTAMDDADEDQEKTPTKAQGHSNSGFDNNDGSTPVKPAAAVLPPEMRREESQRSFGDEKGEEFHSIPSTPIEGRPAGTGRGFS
ncbi:MAG: hypothetical protein Q9190_006851 [Brigantiaea leucoxantha]